MNTPLITARRTTSICFSCRRFILRQFSTATQRLAFPEFQSYRLNPHPLTPPRNSGGADTSISHPIEPSLPRFHETRPPKTVGEATAATPRTSVPEREAQTSQPGFVGGGCSSAPQSSSTTAQATAETGATTNPAAAAKETAPPSSTSASTPPPDLKKPSTSSAPSTRPKSKLRAPRKAAMRLTPTAVEHLRSLLDQPEPKLIKVGVRNRGCSGLAYHLEYVDKVGAFDEMVEQDGVRVLIDSKALFSIIGSEMDWVEDKLNQKFVFRNPNIKEECGCGESFSV